MSLATQFTKAVLYGYLGSLFTYDATFAFATYAAFWLIIFAPASLPAAYPVVIPPNFLVEATLFVPVGVLLGVLIGLAIALMLDVGQMIDVWLTGAAGGADVSSITDDDLRISLNERLNVPYLVMATVAAFVTLFFLVGGYIEPETFLYGVTGPPPYISAAFALFMALAFGLATIILLVLSVGRIKYGERFAGSRDWVSFYYAIAFVVLVLLQEYLPAPTTVGAAFGWAALLVVIFFIVLLVGLYVERNQTPRPSRARLFLIAPTGWNTALKFIVILLVYGGLYVYTQAERLGTPSGELTDVILSTYTVLVLVLTAVAFGLVYVLIMCCCRNPTNDARAYHKEKQSATQIGFESIDDPSLSIETSVPQAVTLARRRTISYSF